MSKQPTAPKKMSAYVRVSRVMGREGESYISPDVQEEAVRAWAKSRGVEIVAVDKDEDQSGGTQARPGLRAAIARIQRGESDGIAVHKLNRFARNVSGGIEDIRTIQAAGGTIAFVEEGIDPTGPFGDFLLTILLAVAELELSSMKQSWQVAKSRAVERGVKIGPTPFGYIRTEKSTLEPDPVFGPVVTEAYNQAAANDLRAATLYLQKHADGERRWDATTVRRMLTKQVYLGHVVYGELVLPNAHEALTTTGVWDLANRHVATERERAAHYPLSGFVVCAGCGEPMIGAGTGRPGGRNLRTYRCRNYAKRSCPAPAMVVGDKLENFVLDAVLDAGVMVPAAVGAGEEPAEVNPSELAAVELRNARQVLDDFTAEKGLQQMLGSARYFSMLSDRQGAVEAAEAAYEAAAGQAASTVQDVAVLISLEQIVWAAIDGDVPPEAPWIFAKRAIDSLTIQKGRGKLDSRVTIEWGSSRRIQHRASR